MTTNAKHKDTHFDEPIDTSKPLSGYGRHGWEVPPEVQQKVIDIIIEEAGKLGFNKRDAAYYIAIAKRESQFNPDAANEGGTASGVAQVTNDTGKTYKVTNKNRFDARSSVKAGLEYFRDLKAETIKDYGSAAEKYEPLVYYRYHYGEFSTHRRETVKGEVVVKEALPFSQLDGNKRYEDSKGVVEEAVRIEKILNDTHGLKIQLADVLGKPMAGRKGIVVQKIAKPAPTATEKSTPASSANLSSESNDFNNGTPVPGSERTPVVEPINVCEIDQVHVKWELVAYEVTSDGEGNFPEINSESQEPFVLLIPRFEYDSYNAAVASGEIPEDGNEHQLFCRNETASPIPLIKAAVIEVEQKVDAKPAAVLKAETPKPKAAPVNVFSASEKGAKQSLPPIPTPDPSISFNDVVIALKKDLGWSYVYATSFAYAKQFFTRPKLPDKPLDEDTKTQKSAARTQAIGSSLKNQDTKSLIVKDKVTTTKETEIKEVKVDGDAIWMVNAIQEQSKNVKEIVGDQTKDADWKKEHEKYKNADKAISTKKKQLLAQNKLPEQKRDLKKIEELREEIHTHEGEKNNANKNMEKIETQYNDPNILKYLKSAGYDTNPGGLGSHDSTAWCASFVNWCMNQNGFVGPKDPGWAHNWTKWGEEITEPKYGAITVVTRDGGHHVGFFTKLVDRDVEDGFDEIEIKTKKGEIVKKKKKKYKKVKYVQLISGNFSHTIREFANWSVSPTDDPLHLVSYRWPTEKDKEKK